MSQGLNSKHTIVSMLLRKFINTHVMNMFQTLAPHPHMNTVLIVYTSFITQVQYYEHT